MEGQTAQITVYDNKTQETFTWLANHNQVNAMRSTDGKSVTAFRYEATKNATDVTIKGVGRNKRRCPKSLKLKIE
jgi:hypothetical protein